MRVGVFGAGVVGSYLGISLSSVGFHVVLLRRRLPERDEVFAAVSLDGYESLASPTLQVTDDPAVLADVDVCLVCVKSRDTAEAAGIVARTLRSAVPVLSMQNGMHNAAALRQRVAGPVVPGVVMFNVYRDDRGRYAKATEGNLYADTGEGDTAVVLRQLQRAWQRYGERLELRSDMPAVQAGKLLLNLNNGVCAAAGIGIAESMRDRDARTAFAMSIEEALEVMRAARIRPARLTVIGPKAIARVLRLPDWFVFYAARSIVAISPLARSSTLQDLERGKPTEIDDLNGEVTQIAARNGAAAPVNQVIVDIVRDHEAAVQRGEVPHFVPPRQLLARLRAASASSAA